MIASDACQNLFHAQLLLSFIKMGYLRERTPTIADTALLIEPDLGKLNKVLGLKKMTDFIAIISIGGFLGIVVLCVYFAVRSLKKCCYLR